jgi:phenylalanine-4-hydroxylase
MMDNHEIWKTLFKGQILNALAKGSIKWVRGWEASMFLTEELPAMEDIFIPHWKVQAIVGKAPEKPFWYRLSRGVFNVNQRLRPEDQIAYLEERDLFHDLFGHTPILFDKEYTDYVRALGVLAQFAHDNDNVRRAISNIYWFTSEFGLVHEKGQLKAYGAGILSSQAELKFAMSDESNKIFITDDNILNNLYNIVHIDGYITDGFQDRYYVLTDWSQLDTIVKWLWKQVGRG